MLSLSFPWKPNHKIRFYVHDAKLNYRWLIMVRFAKNDQSIYLIPLFKREHIVWITGDGERKSFRCRHGDNIYISLHESGVVNLHTSEPTNRVKKHFSKKADVRHIITFQINSVDNLPTATLEEINNSKKRHMHLLIPGFPTNPLMFTIYCAKNSAQWTPPNLGSLRLLHYNPLIERKDYSFHFVAWQNENMRKGEGEMGIQIGGENDSFYVGRS